MAAEASSFCCGGLVLTSPFDEEEVAWLLKRKECNVTDVAKALGADSAALRRFIWSNEDLKGLMDEQLAKGVDRSIAVLFQGLEEEAYSTRFMAAKEFLRSTAGRRRGFHGDQGLEIKASRGATIALAWLEPEPPREDAAPLIEGRVVGQVEEEK
jgi:hypothetical protein